MYVELFLLDNLLMNLLIMRLAAALLSVRPPLYRQAAAVAFTACYAALAAYLWPLLGRPFPRPASRSAGAPLPGKEMFTKSSKFSASKMRTSVVVFTLGPELAGIPCASPGETGRKP